SSCRFCYSRQRPWPAGYQRGERQRLSLGSRCVTNSSRFERLSRYDRELSRVSSAPWQHGLSWAAIYTGVALTTLATLVLELSLTRIFSVVFYYHFAFLAISIALFGLGAGGVFSYVVAGWKGNFYSRLGTLAALNSLAVAASLTFVITRSGDMSNLILALIYFASALPFFFSGTIVSLVISETISR